MAGKVSMAGQWFARRFAWFTLSAVLLLVLGCGDSAQKGVTVPGGSGKDDDARLNDENDSGLGGGPGSLQDAIDPGSSLLDTEYKIVVKSLFDITVCEGSIALQLKATFSQDGQMFNIPGGSLKCLGGLIPEMDISQLLGPHASGGGGAGPGPTGKVEVVADEDNIIAFKRMGKADYDPPRPLLPSFLAADKDELEYLSVSRSVRVRDSSVGKSGSGTTTVRVVGMDRGYTPAEVDFNFRKTLSWEITNDGYDDVPKITNFIFDKMEFTISRDPLSVLRIYFEGSVRDFMDAMPEGQGNPVDGLLGGVLGGAGGGILSGPLGKVLMDFGTRLIKVKAEIELTDQEGLEQFDDSSNAYKEENETFGDDDDDDDDDEDDEDDD